MNLNKCLILKARELKDFDKQGVIDAAEVYQSRGKTEDQANAEAIEDHIRELEGERDRVLGDILGKWKAADPKGHDKAAAAPAPKKKKPVTPQVAAPAGSTPLGVTPKKSAVDDLLNLFGDDSAPSVSASEDFNEFTYLKAQPMFAAAIEEAGVEGDIRESMRAVIKTIVAKGGIEAAKKMQPYIVRYLEDVRAGKVGYDQNTGGTPNEPDQRSNTDLERDSQDAEAANGVGAQGVRAGSGGDGQAGGRGIQDAEGEGRPQRGSSLFGRDAPAPGERGDQSIYTGAGRSGATASPAGSDDDLGGGDTGFAGSPVEPNGADLFGELAESGVSLDQAKTKQKAADKLEHKPGLENIRATLPVLLDGQQQDVHTAETRYAKPDGYGMLFTNGTGTGKTFTGLGIIKRFAVAGKGNVIIAVPSDKIASDWIKSAKMLNLEISKLEDTKDAGKGIVITTYANFGQNDELAKRKWDLVVGDEAHRLSMNSKGGDTLSLGTLQALTMHPDGAYSRAKMLYAPIYARIAELQALAKSQRNSDDMRNWHAENETQAKLKPLLEDIKAKEAAIKAEIAAAQGADRTRALFLSATPFAYEKSIEWGNGYLFDYSESGAGDGASYNSGNAREQFFMAHFGYRMRYNKLTEPDAKVDRGVMQRQFNTWLKQKGSVAGRMLDVKADYDRRFILTPSAIGARIDEALEWFEIKRKAGDARPALGELRDLLAEQFTYLERRYLLEAVKAREVIPHIKEHLALGRKVVVVHDYKKGGASNPFYFDKKIEGGNPAAIEFNAVLSEFQAEFKDLIQAKVWNTGAAIETIQAAFPNVLLFNGDVPKAQRQRNVEKFQDDASGPQVLLGLSHAMKEGVSLHDTTGKHQRVLINLGQPTAPVDSIQIEGRIYRTGQITDAIIRYLNTGTDWEKWAFATTIAQRASAAENLSMGELARSLKDSFIAGFEESDDYRAGMEGEGKGGKERDKAANAALTEYDRARAFYFGTQKKTAKTKAAEGADYFATPEPVGLKMMELADIRPGEAVLEPSAGHGAIARWAPETSARTAIEPSMALRARLAMVFDGTMLDINFEDLHINNKYDAIVLNPPFGTAGRTAIDHVMKAATHLRDGGRIVALIPRGSADAKFDKWFYEESTRPIKSLGQIETGTGTTDAYKGDTITVTINGQSESFELQEIMYGRNLRAKGESASTAVDMKYVTKVERTGPRTESYKAAEGLYLVAEIKLPAVTFERAGTKVSTRIVVLEKSDNAPQQTNRDYSDIEDINELFDRMENLSIAGRAKPLDSIDAGAIKPAKTNVKEAIAQANAAAKAADEQAQAAGAIAASNSDATFELKGDKIVTDAPARQYTTNSGKVLDGVIVPDQAMAKAVDRFTWKIKGENGYFVRLRHIERPAAKLESTAASYGTKAVDVESAEFKAWFRGSKVVSEGGKPLRVYHTTYDDFSEFKQGRKAPDIGFHFGTTAQANDFPHQGASTMPVYLSISNPLRMRDVFGRGNVALGEVALELRRLGLVASEQDAERLWSMRPMRKAVDAMQKIISDAGYDGIVYKNGHEGLRSQSKHEAEASIRIEANPEVASGGREKAYIAYNATGYPVAYGPTKVEAKALGIVAMMRTAQRITGEDSYVALSPDQIKSAVSNTGAFSGPRMIESPENPAYTDVYEPLETRPGTTDKQRDEGRAALDALESAERRILGPASGLRGNQAAILGSAIGRDFRENGGTSFVGKKVTTSGDLAMLGQTVRDPRFETFRIFYTNKAGKILGQGVYSSRLPGVVYLPEDMDKQVAADMAGFRASGYWMMHNHPSGRVLPSLSDGALTSKIAAEVPGFKGHVILDHNQYATIDIADDGFGSLRPESNIVDAPELASKDLRANPEVPHAMLGEQISGPEALALAGKKLQVDPNVAVLVGVDANNKISLIVEVADWALNANAYGSTAAKRMRALAVVRRAARETGLSRIFAVVPGKLSQYFEATRLDFLTDVVDIDGKSAAAQGNMNSSGALPVTKANKTGLKARTNDEPVIDVKQTITSAKTSRKIVPATIRWGYQNDLWVEGNINFDIGSGKFDDMAEAMNELEIENLSYDPFWHSPTDNRKAIARATPAGADTVTVNNVLNVIKEPEARGQVIRQAAKALKPSGTALFLIYEGDKTGEGAESRDGYQTNAKAATFASELEEYFGDVTRSGAILIAKKPIKRKTAGLWTPAEGQPAFSTTAPYGAIDTSSAAFRKWFGDSKVVDADGKPLRMYHGTTKDFEAFRMGWAEGWGSGIYFTDNPSAANEFGDRTYPVFLSIQNPYVDGTGVPNGVEKTAAWRVAKKEFNDIDEAWDESPTFLHDALVELGFDGIIAEGSNGIDGKEVVAFRPDQIKSATSNSGAFDPANPSIVEASRAPYGAATSNNAFPTVPAPPPRQAPAGLQGGAPGTNTVWNAMPDSKLDGVISALQDKHIYTKRAVQAIQGAGRQVADKWDAYLQETLFHGRVAKRVLAFVETELTPLAKSLAMRGLTLEELDEYLHARHAKEANALIEQRNPGAMVDAVTGKPKGSGMTDQAADDYFAALDPSKQKRLAASAQLVDAMLDRTRRTIVAYGLESQDTIDGWFSTFDFYVPLMREQKNDSGFMGIGQGFSIKGKETKMRTGSTRAVVDILANIALQRERAITRGEKNRVSMSLFGLAKLNPNADFWTTDKIPMITAFNPATGVVEAHPDPTYKNRENVVTAKFPDGKGGVVERAVIFNEDNDQAMRAALAMKNLDVAQLEGVLGTMAKITRYFAAVNTQWNPVFGASNFTRDVQEAMLNLSSTPIAGHKREVLSGTFGALAGIYTDTRRMRKGAPAASNWAKLWEEFQREGGQTGYREMWRTSEDRAKSIERAIDPHKWMDGTLGKIFTAGGVLKVPVAVAQDKATWLFDWLSDYNEAMENAVRLSAYKAGIDQGMSKQRAAEMAKNLTVNFNRKGRVTQQAGMLYAFFNASVQGTARSAATLFDMQGNDIKTAKLSKVGMAVVGGGILLGSLQAVMLAALGFDDDEPPEFVRERNIIIPWKLVTLGMVDTKRYTTIPMPLGYRVLPNMGRIATEFAMGGFKKPTHHALKFLGIVADAFNPVGGNATIAQIISPTASDPLVALGENKDWTKKPIAKESYDKTTPGHKLWKDTASTPAKVISEAINWMSGGTDHVAGTLSPTPDQIDYLVGQVTGGVGRELSKLEQTITGLARGEDVPPHKVPLLGRFYGNADSQTGQSSAFYSNVNRINEYEAEIKGLRKDGKHAEANQFIRDNPEARLVMRANYAERQVQKLRKEKHDLVDKGAPREKVKAMEERIKGEMVRFNEIIKTSKKREKEAA